MKTETPKRRLVGLYATSPQLAHACRHAAKRNKSLDRLAVIHELKRPSARYTTLANDGASSRESWFLTLTMMIACWSTYGPSRLSRPLSTCSSRARTPTPTRLLSG